MKYKWTSNDSRAVFEGEAGKTIEISENEKRKIDQDMRNLDRSKEKMKTIKKGNQIIKLKKCFESEINEVLAAIEKNNITDNVMGNVWDNGKQTRLYINDGRMIIVK